MKNLIKKIFSLVGYKIVKNKPGTEVLDKSDLILYDIKNENYKLYKEGLHKSLNEESENFYKQNRFLNLIQIVKYVLSQEKVFDFAECGCWKGHSSFIISKLIEEHKKEIKFHIFDSFEGLSKSTINDKNFNELNKNENERIRDQFSSSESFVKEEVLKDFSFCKFYKGWIPSRFKDVSDSKFSFIHIDVDLYEPTMKSLEFFFPRLEKNGVIVCDDYNQSIFDGSKKAWDNYFSDKEYQFFYENSMGGCFLIK